MPKIKDIIAVLEDFAPSYLQEKYDNSGVQVGDINQDATSAIIAFDVTLDVIDEAIKSKSNLIISHHPITLSGIKQLTGKTLTEQIIIKAIENNIAIYSSHTNSDKIKTGVSGLLANRLGLINQEILVPEPNSLLKIVTFVPEANADSVRDAMFKAGAGYIGNYDSCSYNSSGYGTFRAGDNTNPFVGKIGEVHSEKEVKIESIVPSHLKNSVINAIIKNHPYEEPAYDIYPLANQNNSIGFGIVGDLTEEMSISNFLKHLKKEAKTECIRYTDINKKIIKKIAVCGGSGSSFLPYAISSNADVYVTGDFKYHQFFDGFNKIMIADIGHYESEQFIKTLFYELVTKKFPNFAVRLTEVNSNPINYFY